VQEGPGVAQGLAQGDGVEAHDRDGLGEVVGVLAAAVVRFWCEGDEEAAARAYAALGALLKCAARSRS
jgi:hypothetical protein